MAKLLNKARQAGTPYRRPLLATLFALIGWGKSLWKLNQE